MKYTQPKFSFNYGGKEYSDNWERIFGNRKPEKEEKDVPKTDQSNDKIAPKKRHTDDKNAPKP